LYEFTTPFQGVPPKYQIVIDRAHEDKRRRIATMAIKIQCPRCSSTLAAPNNKAGAYVLCPICKGRLWVDKDAPSDSTAIEAVVPQANHVSAASSSKSPSKQVSAPPVSASVPPPAPPPAAPDSAQHPVLPSGRPPVVSSPPGSSPPVAPPIVSPPEGKKVARFITAEAARSTLKPSEDGKLPELTLHDGAERVKTAEKPSSIHPLALLAVLAVSVALSIVLVLTDTNSQSASLDAKQAEARRSIETKYFGGRQGKTTLENYQVLLRDAQVQHSRGNYKLERQRYREVLNLLRSARGAADKGLTGSVKNDIELEEYISVLLTTPPS
jgi:hypothetical protein